MNKKPTEAQIKEFWEWCGFSIGEYSDEWVAPDNYTCFHGTPPIDLNNLFKFAVPKLEECGYKYEIGATTSSTQHRVAIRDRCFSLIGRLHWNDDPALALFWAIWEVINVK